MMMANQPSAGMGSDRGQSGDMKEAKVGLTQRTDLGPIALSNGMFHLYATDRPYFEIEEHHLDQRFACNDNSGYCLVAIGGEHPDATVSVQIGSPPSPAELKADGCKLALRLPLEVSSGELFIEGADDDVSAKIPNGCYWLAVAQKMVGENAQQIDVWLEPDASFTKEELTSPEKVMLVFDEERPSNIVRRAELVELD
ncbi:hypothetical protein OAO01_01570 [Oligoflexia bacterium]|nr:hypothetical protein [Oligoflexia bacterium]